MEPSKSRRGRPLKSATEQETVRRKIIDAAREVFIDVGFHGLSVELILAKCGLSRPTFYKYFRNTTEPIGIVLREANDQLISTMLAVEGHSDNLFEKIELALAQWRQWGNDMGPLLRPLFRELHDEHSPAYQERHRTLALITAKLMDAVVATGMPRPKQVLVEALINGVEFLGYRYHLETARDDACWQQTRTAMLRMALGLLGSENEWSQAISLARFMEIDLNPSETQHE